MLLLYVVILFVRQGVWSKKHHRCFELKNARPVDEKQLEKDARRTLKKNGIKDPSGMEVDMEPLGW